MPGAIGEPGYDPSRDLVKVDESPSGTMQPLMLQMLGQILIELRVMNTVLATTQNLTDDLDVLRTDERDTLSALDRLLGVIS